MGFNAPIYDEKSMPVESASWDVGTNAHAKWFQIECCCPGVMRSLFACVDIVFDGDWESLTKLMCLFFENREEYRSRAVPCVYRCEPSTLTGANGGVVCTNKHTHKRTFVRPAGQSINSAERKMHYSIAMVCEPLVDDIFFSLAQNCGQFNAGKSESRSHSGFGP